jgi:uncharacterized protein
MIADILSPEKIPADLEAKLARLRSDLAALGKVVIAFSGGVDSSFLVRIAADVLGPDVVALTTRSSTEVGDDFALAVELASALGVRHIVVEADELEIPGYAANPIDRCYFCKTNLYRICAVEAEKLGIDVIADGANLDDTGDYRPGLTAATEHRIRHPLIDAGLTKQDVRDLSHRLGLPTWDKPSSPCLSSRFPYGTTITRDGLEKVAQGERLLHRLGFRECRVRYHDKVARIEVPANEIARLAEPETRLAVVDGLKELGFAYVTVDLQGFRSGSLNEGIVRPVSGS